MQLEIERKWLVDADQFRAAMCNIVAMNEIKQGYLFSDENASVRVRISQGKAILCVKQTVSDLTRKEYEYEIPVKDGEELLKGKHIIHKTRVELLDNLIVDRFHGPLEGLWLCEKEFASEETAKAYPGPSWCTQEVTESKEYLNSNLVSKRYEKSELMDLE